MSTTTTTKTKTSTDPLPADTPITKRLHISGLTPALTQSDITRRLSAFGTVTAVDGFGSLDGLGGVRPFGYVTLETTVGKLARCFSALSGTTWKGAKLRVGLARPDFRERILLENQPPSTPDSEPAKKRRRRRLGRDWGVHAEDMSLVTKDEVAGGQRPGWTVTPLGRVMWCARMRPPRPLWEEPVEGGVNAATKRKGKEKGKGTGKEKKKVEEKKKREKGLAAVRERARRRKIDMVTYGSVHLKGVFVDVGVVPPSAGVEGRGEDVVGTDGDVVMESDGESTDKDEGMEGIEEDEGEEEKIQDESEVGGEPEDEQSQISSQTGDKETSVQAATLTSSNKLKELFAPRDEEEVGFSLLGHLDLDLELDEDVPFLVHDVPQPAIEEPTTTDICPPLPLSTHQKPPHPAPAPMPGAGQGPTHLDPKRSLFFPLSGSSTLGPVNRGKVRDLFDVAKEKKWNWRDPENGFYRTETEDEIRTRWEEARGELTREWKRRWKEAGKKSRRRKGGAGDE